MPRFTVESGLAAELDVRPDAGRDDHQIRVDAFAVGKLDALDASVAAGSPWCCGPAARESPRLSIFLTQVLAAVGIELPLHQRGHQVDDGDVAALHLQPARRLEAEQAAADHHRLRSRA